MKRQVSTAACTVKRRIRRVSSASLPVAVPELVPVVVPAPLPVPDPAVPVLPPGVSFTPRCPRESSISPLPQAVLVSNAQRPSDHTTARWLDCVAMAFMRSPLMGEVHTPRVARCPRATLYSKIPLQQSKGVRQLMWVLQGPMFVHAIVSPRTMQKLLS